MRLSAPNRRDKPSNNLLVTSTMGNPSECENRNSHTSRKNDTKKQPALQQAVFLMFSIFQLKVLAAKVAHFGHLLDGGNR